MTTGPNTSDAGSVDPGHLPLPQHVHARLVTPYAEYLHVRELYDLQTDTNDPVGIRHPEELLFRTVHQSCELWLRLGSVEVGRANAALASSAYAQAQRLYTRAIACVDRVIDASAMLESMPVADYHAFRIYLVGASGLQSPGYVYLREQLMAAAAVVDAGFDTDVLYAVFSTETDIAARSALTAVMDLDAALDRFRARHIDIAIRFLGAGTPGTGGTDGIPFLRRHLGERNVPRLWELSGRIAAASGAGAEGYGSGITTGAAAP